MAVPICMYACLICIFVVHCTAIKVVPMYILLQYTSYILVISLGVSWDRSSSTSFIRDSELHTLKSGIPCFSPSAFSEEEG